MYPPLQHIQKNSYVKSLEEYKRLYKASIENPTEFWSKIANEFYWKNKPSNATFLNYNFDIRKGEIFIKWMNDGVTNVCYNMLDRNIIEKNMGETVAFFWEGNNPDDSGKITYNELLDKVCQFANVLKSLGVKSGDRVAIYMPMIIELTIAMLACARIGAVHSIVFAGYSSQSLAERFLDCSCNVLIVTDGVWRGTKLLNLKKIADEAISICEELGHTILKSIVVRHLSPQYEKIDSISTKSLPIDDSLIAKRPCTSLVINWNSDRDVWWHDLMATASKQCEPEWLNAEAPLFMLYTSGSTGKPKGVLHTQGGYMIYAATTFKYVFDYHPGEIYWCTADVGWITGHSYVCYGPLANGATSVIFEGMPLYPDPGRWWKIIEKYKVSKFYTAPTAIRTLMKYDNEYVKKYDRSSLQILGTVGEPINPEAWLWYYQIVGENNASIVDTFWQTETGGHVITPLPGCVSLKPGSATFPFFGIVAELFTEDGKLITEPNVEGYLVFKQPWPGIMRTVFGNQERFETTYFKKFPGYYCTGDGAKRDEDGYIWVTGRIDDMLNVSGHLLSTAEIESAFIEHPKIAEAAVVSTPHSIKGECAYSFVTVRDGETFDDNLIQELKLLVRKKIGGFAQPEFIQEAPNLPKTRSGKIMRRILRKIAINDRNLGDISTMADESVVDILFGLRPNNA